MSLMNKFQKKATGKDPPKPASKPQSPKPQQPSSGIPAWFVDNCIKLSSDLTSASIPLLIKETKLQDDESWYVESGNTGPEATVFEIDSVIYEAMHTLIAKPFEKNDSKQDYGMPRFKKSYVFLRLPSQRSGRGGPVFLESIVKHFAKDIGANLITFDLDDIEEVAEYMLHAGRNPTLSRRFTLEQYFRADHDVLDLRKELRYNFPFQKLFKALLVKASNEKNAEAKSTAKPWVIHIGNIHGAHPTHTVYRANIIKQLRDAIDMEPKPRNSILLVFSSHVLTEWEDADAEIAMVPFGTQAQMQLLQNGRKFEDSFEHENVRALQKRIRAVANNYVTPKTHPFARWDFLQGTSASRILSKRRFDQEEIDYLVDLMAGDLSDDNIKDVILRADRRANLLSSWDVEVVDDRWSNYPPKIQEVIREVEKDEKKYEWEQKLLSLLVNPDSVEDGWYDIEVDLEIKKTITQMVNQPANSGRAASGILKRGHIGGALLYGPPGTGKTHLARVLARECQAIMISASAADILSEYIGNAEKAIKALFNLGRILAPSIIFVDEADALFGARGDNDRRWERSQINQLLTEMDGLVKAKMPPFVLLATNFPTQLDHALLRRVPCRLHIDLPSAAARERIFQIRVRGEHLDEDVDFSSLADLTEGYSGSDIQTVCLQAALVSESDTTHAMKDGHRLLRKAHFEEALRWSAPTVSKSAMLHIEKFAKENDPWAWQQMVAAGRASLTDPPTKSLPNGASTSDSVRAKTPPAPRFREV